MKRPRRRDENVSMDVMDDLRCGDRVLSLHGLGAEEADGAGLVLFVQLGDHTQTLHVPIGHGDQQPGTFPSGRIRLAPLIHIIHKSKGNPPAYRPSA
jgi:hypothetical protein